MESPVDGVERRGFLGWLLATSAGTLLLSVLYPVIRFISPPHIPEATTSQVEAGPTNDSELLEKGFKIIRFGAEPVILIRLNESDFKAFSATCTHLDCIVEFQKDKERIWCNCHNGHYDMAGRNIAGPPPRPLTAYKVDVVSKGSGKPGVVVVTKV